MGTPEIIWMVILTLANGLFLALRIIEKKNGKKIGNPYSPGEGDICRKNRDIIVELRTKVESIEGDIATIFKKLDK